MMMQLEEPTTVVSRTVTKEAAAEAPPPHPPPPPEAAEEPDGGVEIIVGMDDDNNNNTAAATTSSGEGDTKMNRGGGNRWPRQETLALLKIRSDMDSVFRDSSLKGPLWEDVSRKLGELGYQRSAKKCKEKFENVYKYHKRTKDSRSAKTEGKTKTYRFFDQIEAFESRFNLSHHQPQPQPQPQPQSDHPPKSLSQPSNLPPKNTLTSLPFLSRPSDHSPTTFSFVTGMTTITTANNTTIPSTNNPPVVAPVGPNANLSASTSSSTDSDEDLEERYRKKRKWKDYFRRLTRRVLAKQEEMQKRFLEAIDKRERDRVAQQEAWRMQEMARINREHEILVQERSTAATKDAAIIAFLQKLSGGQQQPPPPPPPRVSVVVSSLFQTQPPPLQQQQQQNQQQQQLVAMPNNNVTYEKFEIQKMNNNNHNINGSSGCGVGASSRWPTAEVHALIRLKTNMEAKYQENGPKAPLWEEISSEMQKLGYNRNSKRCKEKWENINKYFKKIKESNKQRREDSKTCPYYNELEALYKEKTKTQNNNSNNNLFSNSFGHNVEPLMVQPEQQWRPPTQEEEAAREYANHQYQEEDEEEDDEGGVEEEEEEDGGSLDLGNDEEAGGGRGGGRANGGDGGYENNNPKNKLSSVGTVE